MEQPNRPVHSFRYGNVDCSIWTANSHAGDISITRTFKRVFKIGDEWGESASFDDRDLPNLMKAAADAHSWIHQQKAQAAAEASAADNA